MTITDILFKLIPVFSVSFFYILEVAYNKRSWKFSARDSSLFLIEFFALLTSLGVSFLLFKPLVNFYGAFELVSLSRAPLPHWLSFLISFLLLDLFVYTYHRLNHIVPLLWRFHRLHHADKEVDSFSSLLHHPFEILSNSISIIAFYIFFDIPVVVVLAYYVSMTLHGAVSHTLMLLPKRLDLLLRYFVVTPNMHRVHHSIKSNEGNLNFGAIFPYWDKLFGTYLYIHNSAFKNFNFGIERKASPKFKSISSLIVNPFI
jgi:sterol desaturase/sphingolipid hydroxylase (fatty acid hydroxylase superfamily)